MKLPFYDRCAAGSVLSLQLRRDYGPHAVVLGIARGGIPVAREIARSLELPLGVVPVRKIVLPGKLVPIGAVADQDVTVWNERIPGNVDRSPYFREALLAARERLGQLQAEYASLRFESLRDKWVILVDDGIETGMTMRAAIASLRHQDVAGITVAVPVASKSALARVSQCVEEIECLALPEPFHDIGQSYLKYSPVHREQVHP